MRRPLVRAALWLLSSSALLLIGFAAGLGGLYLLGRATGRVDPERARIAQFILTTYFRVVFFKGLLPQLALALALWPALRRFLPWVERSWTGRAVGLALAAGMAYAVVGPLLLSAEFPGWPALRMGLVHHARTGALMTGGVALSALVACLLVPGLRPGGASRG